MNIAGGAPSEQDRCDGLLLQDITGDLELDRPPRLLLNDDRASPNLRSGDHIADPDFDQVAAAKFAGDRKVEQGAVTNATLMIEEEADGPDLFLQ